MSKVVDEDMVIRRHGSRSLMEHTWLLLAHGICHALHQLMISAIIEERRVLKVERNRQ